MTNAHDGSNRLFVVHRSGTIRVFKNGAYLPTPFLDVSSLISCCDERGLLSIAFHPYYATNGFFYITNRTDLVLPVIEETHDNGWCALIGGYRYRGTAIPGLAGYYLYSDNCLGSIYAASPSGSNWSRTLLLSTALSTSSFGEDEAGEIYLCDLNGAVYRLDPQPRCRPRMRLRLRR